MSAVRTADPVQGAGRLVRVGGVGHYIASEPRRLSGVVAAIDHPLARARYQSPLRYPGAKSGLAELIGQLIQSARKSRQVGRVDLLVEPFGGGASTSLRLVGNGTVERILLADANPLVAAFWQVAASDTEALVDRMADEHRRWVAPGGPRALERWDYWRAWTAPAGMSAGTVRFESAIKCLFLNRTTFSGILHGQAGPIGGRAQTSDYKIGCRFNVVALAERLRYVGHLYDSHRLVDVWCKDWRKTLESVPEWYPQLIPNRVLAYLDPPYLEKSRKLYQRSFDSEFEWSGQAMHLELAEYVRRQMQFRWVLSYDAQAELLSSAGLYAASQMTPTDEEKEQLGIRSWAISKRVVTLSYTASARSGRGPANELLLTTLPASTVPNDDRFRPASGL